MYTSTDLYLRSGYVLYVGKIHEHFTRISIKHVNNQLIIIDTVWKISFSDNNVYDSCL